MKEFKARRVFITAHVAALLERQEFILKLARALMMYVSLSFLSPDIPLTQCRSPSQVRCTFASSRSANSSYWSSARIAELSLRLLTGSHAYQLWRSCNLYFRYQGERQDRVDSAQLKLTLIFIVFETTSRSRLWQAQRCFLRLFKGKSDLSPSVSIESADLRIGKNRSFATR